MDEFSEKYYSKWRDEDVVGLIPELADFFKKPEDFDAEGFIKASDEYYEKQILPLIKSIGSNPLIAAVRDKSEPSVSEQLRTNPDALQKTLEELEKIRLELEIGERYCSLLPKHFSDYNLVADIDQHLAEWADFAKMQKNQITNATGHIILSIPDDQLKVMLKTTPGLKPFEPYILHLKNDKSKKAGNTPDSKSHMIGMDKLNRSNNILVNEEEKKALFA